VRTPLARLRFSFIETKGDLGYLFGLLCGGPVFAGLFSSETSGAL
jgi:hypothetical protein